MSPILGPGPISGHVKRITYPLVRPTQSSPSSGVLPSLPCRLSPPWLLCCHVLRESVLSTPWHGVPMAVSLPRTMEMRSGSSTFTITPSREKRPGSASRIWVSSLRTGSNHTTGVARRGNRKKATQSMSRQSRRSPLCSESPSGTGQGRNLTSRGIRRKESILVWIGRATGYSRE